MTVVGGDPFGLFHSPRRVGATDRLIVYPMTVEINRVILPVGFLTGGDAQRQLTHQITTNASSIRDYVSGDSMNRIHWRSTARTGNIMVKEFELDPLVDIWLLNDFSKESLCEDPRMRRAIALATSFRVPAGSRHRPRSMASSSPHRWPSISSTMSAWSVTPRICPIAKYSSPSAAPDS